MPLALRNIVFSFIALTAATALAEQAQVSVPFSFVAMKHVYPAGSYDVTMDPSRSFITLTSRTYNAKTFTMVVSPAEKANAETVLLFNNIGPNYCLKTIQVGSKISQTLKACDEQTDHTN